jgi:hypothetical protein
MGETRRLDGWCVSMVSFVLIVSAAACPVAQIAVESSDDNCTLLHVLQ